ncbi:sensor histidine kinase [Streptomyces sp. NPDC048639]|uniref:sensor histidine kinase n=1 Tax=Streptomyces sp. NPDC048639 TaxID=3365581 RepID=UPI003723B3D7
MLRVARVNTPTDVLSRLLDALRTLSTDLMTAERDPLPPMAGPRWLRRLPHVLVVLLAVLTFVFSANELLLRFGDPHTAASTAGGGLGMGPQLALPIALAKGGAVLLAMSRPVPAWWLSMAMASVVAWAAMVYGPGGEWPWAYTGLLADPLVLLLLALRVPVRVAGEALGLSLGLGLALGGFAAGFQNDSPLFPGAAVSVVAVVLGAALRGRREARSSLAQQAVLTEEERARRTVLEERSRIARELHDVVAHHMSVISIQAQVAPHLATDPSDELKENLAGIRQNAVDALTELRRVLGVLRSEAQDAGGAAPHAPLPTLQRLGALVENARAAGLTVRCDTSGEPRPLTPGVELSAYRIVQEALSNAIRHAPGSTVGIELAHNRGGLRVRIANTAPRAAAPPSPGAGHGLLGMRERATMLGGDLATGPTPDGGYEVTAFLPAGGETRT